MFGGETETGLATTEVPSMKNRKEEKNNIFTDESEQREVDGGFCHLLAVDSDG
jgi:hypothetical protein